MASINQIEDLDAWKLAKDLMVKVYELVSTFPKYEDYNIVKHLRECSRNILANIAEGFGRYGFQEGIQFYRIARGSLNELKSDILCAFDLKYFDKEVFNNLISQVEKLNMLINGLIKSSTLAKDKFKNHL